MGLNRRRFLLAGALALSGVASWVSGRTEKFRECQNAFPPVARRRMN